MVWLSGSGGTGKTPSQLCVTSKNALLAERWRRCSLEPVLASTFLLCQNNLFFALCAAFLLRY